MHSSPTDKPDFEGFAKEVMKFWPIGDVDGGDLQDLAIRFNLLRSIPGGFDPAVHVDFYGCAEPGDEWFQKTYSTKDTIHE